MAPGFITLRHQRMHPGTFCLLRFGQAGHRTQQDNAGVLERIDGRLRRQAEMETDHRRFFFQQHVQHAAVLDERGVDLTQRRWRYGFELGKERSKKIQPLHFALGVMDGGCVAEQIHIERFVRQRGRLAQHGPRLLDVARTDADRTEPAGIGHRRRESGCGNTDHRRLNDRQFDVQKGQQRIGHGST
ncbi:hypothetical protein D3C76_1260140 [compost metagenome]